MIDDIINEHARAVIVVESPHHDEIETGIPLSGESGKVVSRVLLRDTPIGPLCNSGYVPLSIVNTFSQPRQFDVEGETRPALLRDLDDLRYVGLKEYKRDIYRILDASRDEHLLHNYERRITEALEVAFVKKHPSPESGRAGVSAWELPENAQHTAALREFVGPISPGPTE